MRGELWVVERTNFRVRNILLSWTNFNYMKGLLCVSKVGREEFFKSTPDHFYSGKLQANLINKTNNKA